MRAVLYASHDKPVKPGATQRPLTLSSADAYIATRYI